MQPSNEGKALGTWIPDDMLAWLNQQASENGHDVEMEILARLQESRQRHAEPPRAKKKPWIRSWMAR